MIIYDKKEKWQVELEKIGKVEEKLFSRLVVLRDFLTITSLKLYEFFLSFNIMLKKTRFVD